jgi:hypothetical protein
VSQIGLATYSAGGCVSPIFVRPVREQLEHDRLIRHLQLKYNKKFEVAINLGEEQGTPVKIGQNTFFPDLVLTDGRKLAGLVEVESGESVNNLEAMAQWVHFSRAKVPFHLYVPVQGYDAARRLCESNQARVSEIWTYRPAMDGFDLVRMYADTSTPRPAPRAAAPEPPARKPVRPVAAAKATPAKTTPRRGAPASKVANGARANGARANGRTNGKAPARSAAPARPAARAVAARKKPTGKAKKAPVRRKR